jgi:hypothetical protein
VDLVDLRGSSTLMVVRKCWKKVYIRGEQKVPLRSPRSTSGEQRNGNRMSRPLIKKEKVNPEGPGGKPGGKDGVKTTAAGGRGCSFSRRVSAPSPIRSEECNRLIRAKTYVSPYMVLDELFQYYMYLFWRLNMPPSFCLSHHLSHRRPSSFNLCLSPAVSPFRWVPAGGQDRHTSLPLPLGSPHPLPLCIPIDSRVAFDPLAGLPVGSDRPSVHPVGRSDPRPGWHPPRATVSCQYASLGYAPQESRPLVPYHSIERGIS